MAAGVKITGLRKTRARMKKLGKQGMEAFRAAMYVEGLHVIGQATKNAPAVTGRLRNSHFVTWPSRVGTVRIGFGVIYAASVEAGIRIINMSRQRQKAAWANINESGWRKSTVGGSHFMRRALDGARGGMGLRIAKRTQKFFEQGRGFRPFPGKPKSPGGGRQKARAKGKA